MNIEPVLWDSDFFGYPIGKIVLQQDEIIDEEYCRKANFKLIYVFSETELSLYQTEKLPIQLTDCKVELETTVKLDAILPNLSIQPIRQLNNELLHLVYQSGHYSRYKLDKHFVGQEFERMYLAWITKVLNDKNQQALAFIAQDKIVGFITLGKKNKFANIGLIAVDENFRGKNIGHHLINQAHWFAQQQNLTSITVNTQLANIGAMRFYLKQGFDVVKKTYIYHLWK